MKDYHSLSFQGQVTFIFHQLAIFIAILGIVGNVCSFLVLSRKNLRKYSFSFYIRLMTAFDLFTLLTQFRHWLAFMVDLDVRFASNLFCKLADFSVFSTSICSL